LSPKVDRKQVGSHRIDRWDAREKLLPFPDRQKNSKWDRGLALPGRWLLGPLWGQLEGEEVAAWLNSLGITGIIVNLPGAAKTG